MSRFDPNLYVGRDELGAVMDDLEAQIAEGALQTALAVVGVDVPIIDLTTPAVFTDGKKGKIYITLRFTQYGSATDIKVVFVQRSEITNATDYDTNRFSGKLGDKIASGTTFWTSRIDVLLNPSTQYDIIRLVAIGGDGTERAANPNPDPTYAPTGTDPGYPANVLYTFTTPAQASAAHAPSKPTTARISRNIPDPQSNGSLSITTLRIFADETELLDFAFQGTVSVQPKVIDDGGFKAPAPAVAIEDSSALFADVAIGGLLTGRQYEWTKNTAFDGDGFGAQALSTSPVTFIAGGFADPAGGLGTLTFVSATSANTEDPNTVAVTFVLHQPDPAFKLKNYTAKRKVASKPDTDYDLPDNIIVPRENLDDPIYSTPGNISITFLSPVKPAKTYRFKITVRTIGLAIKDFTSGDLSAASLTLPAALTAAQGGPSYIDGGGFRASLKDYDDTFAPPGAAGDAKYLGSRLPTMWQTFANSGVRIDNLGSGGGGSLDADGVDWVSTEARLLLDTTIVTRGGKPAFRLGKILSASEDWSGNILLISQTADVVVDITMAFLNSGGDICTATKTGFVISHTEYVTFFFILLVPSTFTRNGKEWLELRLGADPSQKIWTKNWQIEPLVAYHQWKMNQTEAQVSPTTNPTDTGQGLVTQLPITVIDDGVGAYKRDGFLAGGISLD